MAKHACVGFCGRVPHKLIDSIKAGARKTLGGCSMWEVDFDEPTENYVTELHNFNPFNKKDRLKIDKEIGRMREVAHEAGLDAKLVEYAERRADEYHHVMFLGIRFKEEADYVRSRGGVVYALDPDEFPECDARSIPSHTRPELE